MRVSSRQLAAVRHLRCAGIDLSAYWKTFALSCSSLAGPASNTRTMSAQETPDYSSYSQSDLLARVTDLEAQLRALNAIHALSTQSSPGPLKKKGKKGPKPFDPSIYSTRFIALKFAYLGGSYNGFEHHSNNTTPLPTIEDELWRALKKTKLIFPEVREGQSEDEVCWDGVEYSKCGRTDKGVSAFGQVVGLRVRSSQPRPKRKDTKTVVNGDNEVREHGSFQDSTGRDSLMPDALPAAEGVPLDTTAADASPQPTWDPIRNELPYIQLLNRVLPPDIRILAWCPYPPLDFSARFSCKERRYRYFFTNPAYASAPGYEEGGLNIEAMHQAAAKYEGLHDFRNFCKVDASKQITNFERRIFHAGIHPVRPDILNGKDAMRMSKPTEPELYYFEVRGSAFLWHQVRHLIAVLFLVGQGYEQPQIVDKLLDVKACPSKPVYEMADDRPLVLWDCIFPDLEKVVGAQQDHLPGGDSFAGYENALDWVYVGDEAGGRDTAKRVVAGVDDGKFGRNGIMDDLWALWRKRKIDEVLAGSLMSVVANQRSTPGASDMDGASAPNGVEHSARIFDGGDRPRPVGKYIPVVQRERAEAPEVLNARYAARKGLTSRSFGGGEADMEE